MKQERQNTIQFKNFLKELKLSNLAVKKQEELLKEMAEIIYKRILLRIVKRLSEKEIIELDSLLNKKDFNEIDKYVDNKVADFVEIFKQEIETFQGEMIEIKRE